MQSFNLVQVQKMEKSNSKLYFSVFAQVCESSFCMWQMTACSFCWQQRISRLERKKKFTHSAHNKVRRKKGLTE